MSVVLEIGEKARKKGHVPDCRNVSSHLSASQANARTQPAPTITTVALSHRADVFFVVGVPLGPSPTATRENKQGRT